MTSFLAQLLIWCNVPMNGLGRILQGVIGTLPGYVSNTIISAITGILLLIIYKYTSNQRAIGRVRNEIKANLLSLKLFKDSIIVTLQAQGRLFRGAFLLLLHSLIPMLIMIVPVILLLAQMGMWYQSRPLHIGEETVVTVKVNGDIKKQKPGLVLQSTPAVEATVGPVRIFTRREICWKIKAKENGYHQLIFSDGEQKFTKNLVIGDGYMRINPERPNRLWSKILLNPDEEPFGPESTVQSISIIFPERESYTSGSDWWLVYFFVASMVFAFLFKPLLKVKI